MRMVPSRFDRAEYALYCKYQVAVHKDDPEELSEAAYCRFLVDSPLVAEPAGGSHPAPACGFGSFHQQYWLAGRLVAVGVVDVLPRCLSSKYLFWDPDLAALGLGKYSALAEIAWVSQQQAGPCPSLAFYYMGFYIHTCPKMRYKAAFKPSQLLCPARFAWVPFAAAAPRLDAARYAQLATDDASDDARDASDASDDSAAALEASLLFFPGQGVARLGALAGAGALSAEELGSLRSALASWRQGVGPAVARRAACVCWRQLTGPAPRSSSGSGARPTAERQARNA
jgi:arginine-tRNA-protein transferase